MIEGERPVNVAAWAIHAAIHKLRPDVIGSCHVHSLYAKTWSALGRPLAPITLDACAFFEDHANFDEITGSETTARQATRQASAAEFGMNIARALGSRKAALLRHHGLLTVGGSIDSATWFCLSLERCCQSALLAAAAGGAEPIPDEVARRGGEFSGSEFIGWSSFQPLYELILASEPELTD